MECYCEPSDSACLGENEKRKKNDTLSACSACHPNKPLIATENCRQKCATDKHRSQQGVGVQIKVWGGKKRQRVSVIDLVNVREKDAYTAKETNATR